MTIQELATQAVTLPAATQGDIVVHAQSKDTTGGSNCSYFYVQLEAMFSQQVQKLKVQLQQSHDNGYFNSK